MQNSFKSSFFKKLFVEIVFLFFLSGVLTIFLTKFSLALLSVSGIFLFWHYYMGLKLVGAIFKKKPIKGFSAGIWALIFDQYNYVFLKKSGEQKQLLQLIAHFKKAFDKIKQGILVCDANHNIFWSNASASRILQIGHKKNLLHSQHNLNFRTFVEKLAKSKSSSASLFFQKGQNHYRIRGYKLEERYLLLIENITKAEVAKLRQSRILSYINHDLRTPLTVMSGYLEMLEADSSLLQKVLEPIKTQSEKIKSLIQELSALDTLSEENHVAQNWCDFSILLQKIAKDVQKLYPDYPLALNIKSSVQIKGEELNLNRLVTNLVYNAIKHNPKGTPIFINLEQHKEGIRFGVKDEGLGIDAEHLPYLTVRFYRGDKARDTSDNQNGLGLAIVKHILESYGTKIEVKSQKFIGSEFYFYLKPKFVDFK